MILSRETVDGVALLLRPGPGPTLMLLHGVGSDALTWAPVLSALDPEVNAIAWDAPGYGSSATLDISAPAPADYADRLTKLLDSLRIERVVLAGHSLGTLFAASFAARHPARLTALALLSPSLGYRVAPGEALPTPLQKRIADLAALGPQAFAAKRAARLVYRAEQRPDVLEGVRRAMAAVRPDGYAQAVHALGAGDLLGDIAGIAAPTLVAIGMEDLVTPPSNAVTAHAALRQPLPLEVVPECGHALPQEAPEIVARLLSALVHGHAHV